MREFVKNLSLRVLYFAIGALLLYSLPTAATFFGNIVTAMVKPGLEQTLQNISKQEAAQ